MCCSKLASGQERPSAVESPACRTVRLCGGDPEGGVEGEAVELPGWRPGARGAERRGEGISLHLRGPATFAIQTCRRLQCRLIRDSGRLALKNEVDPLQPDRNGAGRVGCQITCFAGLWPARQIEVAVEPE